jgi:predicted transcriptional regulator
LSETILILRRTERDMIKNVYRSAACTEIFSKLSHKRHYFRKKITEFKMCVLILSTSFVWNIYHSKKNWARYDQKCISVSSMYSYFSTLSHKRHDFRKKDTEYKMCDLVLSTSYVWNNSHSKKNWARYDQKCISVCCKYRNYFHLIS